MYSALSVRMQLVIICAFAVCLILATTEQQDFSGEQVLRIVPETQKQVDFLAALEKDFSKLDFWKQPYYAKHWVDVRVPQSILTWLKQTLHQNDVNYSVLVDDVQKAVDIELDSIVKTRKKRSRQHSHSIDDLNSLNNHILNSFTSHSEITEWLKRIASERCGSRCSLHTIGYTGEGRNITVIKISGSQPENGRNKTAIWIDGGVHAREWISPVTANNIIYKLITEYDEDRCVQRILDNFDWYILPVANPDGYEYSRVRNRMWRKNRKKCEAPRRPWWTYFYYGSYKYCYGVDLNRNFGFKWGETGTSTNPCSDIYGGSEAFSEPETMAIRNFTSSIHHADSISVYLSLHAYGQYWLYSWGYTTRPPIDHKKLNRIATKSTDAIFLASNRKTRYTVGAAASTLYASSGASDDWAKGHLGVNYAFTVELPPSDTNSQRNGFLLPVSAIPGVIRDIWPGIKTMAASVLADDMPSTNNDHDFCYDNTRHAEEP